MWQKKQYNTIGRYRATIRIDGINKTIARSFTNILRSHGVSVRMVKGKRDEAEPFIRLADMWAGCVQSALLGEGRATEFFARAKRNGYLREVITENPPTFMEGFRVLPG